MKRNLRMLSLAALIALLFGGMITKEKKSIEVNAQDTTYIPMEAASFTNWTADAGEFASKDATYWGPENTFEALDTFFRGETKEGWTGTLTLNSWVQKTQYVYFTWGGANNIDDTVHLKFHYGSYSYTMLNNTFVGNEMLLRYFRIPDAEYATLDNVNGFTMYIELVDNRTYDFAFHNFGYLHVNQTEEAVGDAMRFYLNNLSTLGTDHKIGRRKAIQDNYLLNSGSETGLKDIFLKASLNINEDFESQDAFLKHWYFDHKYFNDRYTATRHFDKVISTGTVRPGDDTLMPFNKTGNGFFRGWYENDTDGGFVAADDFIYRFVSRPYVLTGDGLISIKMAGTASLHIIDADSQENLAYADLLTFSSSGNQSNIALSGFNTVTMVRHIINLEAYVGRKIQVAITDFSDGGWSAAYFDELNLNFDSTNGFTIDAITQANTHGTFYITYLDRYINSSLYDATTNPTGLKYVHESTINTANDNEILNHIDASNIKNAHEFVTNYLAYARNNDNGTSLCGVLTTNEMKTIVNNFNLLNAGAQSIVWASDDYQRYGATADDWYEFSPTILELGSSLTYVAGVNKIAIPSYGLLHENFTINTVSNVFIIISLIIFIIYVFFMMYRKKNKQL